MTDIRSHFGGIEAGEYYDKADKKGGYRFPEDGPSVKSGLSDFAWLPGLDAQVIPNELGHLPHGTRIDDEVPF